LESLILSRANAMTLVCSHATGRSGDRIGDHSMIENH